MRPSLAEFFATALMMIIGTGVNNQVFLNSSESVSSSKRGEYLSISIGWGAGVMIAIYLSGGISGGHLNPVVTICLAVYRGFPWPRVLPYCLAQIFGAFVGSSLVQIAYAEALDLYEGGEGLRTAIGPNSTGNFFFTSPAAYLSNAGSFYQEFLDTAILVLMVFALADRSNTAVPSHINPLAFMWLVVGIGASLGCQTGYAMNPARDFGPRLMATVFGYQSDIWTTRHSYWVWNPCVATLAGGLFGGFLYDFFLYEGSDSPLNGDNPHAREIALTPTPGFQSHRGSPLHVVEVPRKVNEPRIVIEIGSKEVA